MQNRIIQLLVVTSALFLGLLSSAPVLAVGISVGWPIPLSLRNNGGVFENLYYGNAANNSTPGTSLLLLQKDSIDIFKVGVDGQITVSGNLNVNSGTLKVDDKDICLADGTNCPSGTDLSSWATFPASANIQLSGKWLSNDGGNEGIKVDNSGLATFSGSGLFTTDVLSNALYGKSGNSPTPENIWLGDSSDTIQVRGNIDINNKRIINLATPTAGTDATTKAYVDTAVAAISGDNLGNHTATINLNMSSLKVVNLATPTVGTDAATKAYVDSKTGDNLGNHIATVDLNLSSKKIINLATPTTGTDATTKAYVDTAVAGISGDNLGNHLATTNLNINGNELKLVDKIEFTKNSGIPNTQNIIMSINDPVNGHTNQDVGVYAQRNLYLIMDEGHTGNGNLVITRDSPETAPYLFIKNGGQVGINTASPVAGTKLDVNGAVNINGQTRITGKILTGSSNYGTNADISMGQNCYTPNHTNLPGWPKLILQENGYGVFGFGLGCAQSVVANELRIISGMNSPVSIGKITNPAGTYIETIRFDNNNGTTQMMTNATAGGSGGNVEIQSYYNSASAFGGGIRVNEYYDPVNSRMEYTRNGPAGTLEMKEWGDWSFTTTPYGTAGGNANNVNRVSGLTIKNDGRVGIRTTGNNWNDGTKMDSGTALTIWNPNGGAVIDAYGSASAPYDYTGIRFWDDGITSVGTNSNNQHWGIWHKNSRAPGFTDHDLNINYWTGSQYRDYLVIKAATGNVGIGKNNPAYKMDIAGSIRVNSTVYSSDIRLKENITSLDNALSKILVLRGVEYNWKDKNLYGSDHQIGLIAQEVEKVLPEVVATDGDGYKSIDYAKVVPVLIEAIKDQQSQIDALNLKLKEIK